MASLIATLGMIVCPFMIWWSIANRETTRRNYTTTEWRNRMRELGIGTKLPHHNGGK